MQMYSRKSSRKNGRLWVRHGLLAALSGLGLTLGVPGLAVSAPLNMAEVTDNPPARSYPSGLDLAAGSRLLNDLQSSQQVPLSPLVQPWGILVDRELSDQRELYARIHTLIQRNQFSEAQRLLPSLTGYPLFPYLEGALLESNIRYANEAVILEFLAEHGNIPVARSLRTEWLQFLRRNNDDERYLRDYQPQTALSLQCHYLRAQYRTRQDWQGDDETNFFNAVTRFWLQGESLPSACDALFRIWADAGYRTPTVVWQRAELALAAGQTSLFRFLNRMLDQDAQQLLDIQRRLRTNPNTVVRFNDIQQARRYTAPDHDTDELLMGWIISAIGRLRWNDIDAAIGAWERYQQVFSFTAEQQLRVNADLAVTLALRGEPSALAWFAKVPIAEMSPAVLQWHLASLLRLERFDLIAEFISAMPEVTQQQPQWLYWHGRALAQLGYLEDATELYVQAAQTRSYYGFLASARMSLPVQLNHEDTAFHADNLVSLSQQPEAMRARELQHHGERLAARREWNLLRARQPQANQLYVAILASEWGWHDQAIFGLAGSTAVNDVYRRFPLAYAHLIQSNAARVNIAPEWVFAIARRESSFQADAVSPVGARGLLQIMPDTANYLTRGSVGAARGRARMQLERPEDNVQLGTQYMAELLYRNDNNWLLATAAYNAGNRRVLEWIPEQPMAADIWVELIPFQETRDYVKAVLAYQQIYALQLGKDANVLQPVVRMRISNNGSS